LKRILYIGNNLSEVGKTQTTIESLSKNLREEGYTVYVFSNKKLKLWRLFDMLFAVLKYASKVDYVLIDTYSTQNFLYAYLVSQLCRILNLKYVPILHGGNLPSRLQSHPRLSKALFHHAYKNISPSLYIKSEFEKRGYSNIVCIPNTIDIPSYPYKQRGYDTINLLWVRSFSKIYNPLLAIKLFKALQEEGFKATLCMVGPEGDGSLQEAKDLAKALGVEVTFTGKLSKKSWIQRSENYNIFINTTNFDNMPVSVMEAMALGLPIVSTNVGGMPFLINNGNDGILVNPNDVDGFLKSIKWLVLHPKEANNMAQQARTKAEQFDWKIIKKKWHFILNN
jgi:glycosyltransferase involved in cell wall biosynthesis